MDSERGGVGISAFILPDGVVGVEDGVSLLDSMLRRGVVPELEQKQSNVMQINIDVLASPGQYTECENSLSHVLPTHVKNCCAADLHRIKRGCWLAAARAARGLSTRPPLARRTARSQLPYTIAAPARPLVRGGDGASLIPTLSLSLSFSLALAPLGAAHTRLTASSRTAVW